jgi:hypothetical protein
LAIQDKKCLNYCSNDAICKVNDGIIQCYCLPEWDGERCDIPREIPQDYQFLDENFQVKGEFRSTPCDLVPGLCLNGGVCYVNETASGAKLSCQCLFPKAGPRCEETSGKIFSIFLSKCENFYFLIFSLL